ncbi:bacteriocin fulvocin C-related protein [Kribbella solani]|uniref:Uncharacterized protein n=1 Tax=Kribbella solani TaxID=236067 RepID=A0A841E374_9ACTN|nr:hypothetical protein [Kribbella solani]
MPEASKPRAQLDRKQFLRLGLGAGVAAGIVLTGKLPAFATGTTSDVQAWVDARQGRLPQTYDEITRLPMAYRRAVFTQLSLPVRQELWLEQLRRHRATGPALVGKQAAVLDEFEAFVRRGFEHSGAEFGTRERFDELVRSAYRREDAQALFGTLGPVENAGMAPADSCACSTWDDWCGDFCAFRKYNCTRTSYGCGGGWSFHCDGYCN